MLIQHDDHSADRVKINDQELKSLGAGVFDVDHDAAERLCSFPHWSPFCGDPTTLQHGLLEPVVTDADRRRWDRDAKELAEAAEQAEADAEAAATERRENDEREFEGTDLRTDQFVSGHDYDGVPDDQSGEEDHLKHVDPRGHDLHEGVHDQYKQAEDHAIKAGDAGVFGAEVSVHKGVKAPRASGEQHGQKAVDPAREVHEREPKQHAAHQK